VCHPVDTGQVLVITRNGYGKRTALDEYPVHGRGGGGVATIARNVLDLTGPIAAARIVQVEDEITVVSAQGNALRLMVSTVPESGRSTRGSRLMQLREGDSVASVARLKAAEMQAVPAAEGTNGDGAGQPAEEPDTGTLNGAEPVDGAEGQQESP
jgi:DNA gyrase subunit A